MNRLVIAFLGAGVGIILLAGCMSPLPPMAEPPAATTTEPPPPAKPGTAAADWQRWDREGPNEIRSSSGRYLRSRFYDFTDMFDVGLSFGRWGRIEADYFLGFYGFGATDVTRWRFGQRSFILNEESTTFCTLPFPASLVLFPAMLSKDKAQGAIITLGGVSYETEKYIWPDNVFAGIPPQVERIRIACAERDREAEKFKITAYSLGIGLEAHFLIGARAKVYPLQVFDFITGIFGWDLLGDDPKF